MMPNNVYNININKSVFFFIIKNKQNIYNLVCNYYIYDAYDPKIKKAMDRKLYLQFLSSSSSTSIVPKTIQI